METGRKPVITYAGESAVFQQLQSGLLAGLPQEEVEWRRSYGRPPRAVTLEAGFEPFSETLLTDDLSTLVRRPCLHTFWTDCSDIEVYKSSTRDALQAWLALLRAHNVVDWLVVVVEPADVRSKANKLLPRSSVLDKVKADINTKHGDRCLTLLDPSKSDARSAGSLQHLLQKMRHFLLIGFNRVLVRFEDTMRSQREKRTSSDWSFCSYFPLQEELSFVFQQLGLFDEALVQYDELDALFTQFILNSCAGDTPRWLQAFSQPVTSWHGLSVPASCCETARQAILGGQMSLLSFRNYLFARQCVLLQRLGRTAEVAHRTLNFLFNTINELKLMELDIVKGGVACWAFVTCMNVLDLCRAVPADAATQEGMGVHTACLYDQARIKLNSLGELCGLLPESGPSSKQLHLIVTLSAGMGDSSPAVDKLKEALSSPEALQRCYLELSELAMGTYKHMGRLRSARLVGLQLATFHLRLAQPAHAASLLTDALKTFQDERWGRLAAQILLQLAICYQRMDDRQRYLQTCATIAGSPDVADGVRSQFAQRLLQDAHGDSSCVTTSAEGVLNVGSLSLVDPDRVPFPGSNVEVTVNVESRLPVALPLRCCRADVHSQEAAGALSRNTSSASTSSTGSSRQRSGAGAASPSPAADVLPSGAASSDQLQMEPNIEYKQDRSLAAATLVCKNIFTVLRRKDSQPSGGRQVEPSAGAADVSLQVSDVTLQPGPNQLALSGQVTEAGAYALKQLLFCSSTLDFVADLTQPLRFDVKSSPPKVSLNKAAADLLAGTVQHMTLLVACGSEPITEGGSVQLLCSRGLTLRQPDGPASDWREELELQLPPMAAVQTVELPILALSQLAHVKDGVSLVHKVSIFCPWSATPVEAELCFRLPFSANFKLHTANVRKFVQVVMHGLSSTEFELSEPTVAVLNSAPVTLHSLNDEALKLSVCDDRSAAYMWEMTMDSDQADQGTPPVRAQFSVDYKAAGTTARQRFKFDFTIADYKTLLSVSCRVEPVKGAEFCRAGAISQLQMTVAQEDAAATLKAVMYEVLADQNLWAVCGRSSGVLNMGPEARHTIQVEVMPLTGGYLPLPTVRLSRYLPAAKESGGRSGVVGSALPRLEPFAAGQVYSASRAQQVHVLATAATAAAAPAAGAGDASLT